MSYDLRVATTSRPEQQLLIDFTSKRKGITLVGSIDANASNATLTLGPLPATSATVKICSPVRASEAEDLDEGLAALIPPPCWLTEMGVPGFTERGIELANELARFIADSCKGAILDPQVGAVTWPEARREPVPRKRREERIREIRLEWYLPPRMSDMESGRAFLSILRDRVPEAIPTRFGTFEPFQGRLEAGDDEPFLSAWSDLTNDPLGMLDFKSKKPCFGGSVHLPRARLVRPGQRQAAEISLAFDGRILDTDKPWREKVVSLFCDLAERLHAFYARAYVVRNVIASGHSLAYDSKVDFVPSGMILASWCGIPPTPAWMVWFGAPYKDMVRESLIQTQLTESASGIFIRLGEEPLDTDQLRGMPLGIPNRLVAKHQPRPPIRLVDGKTATILGFDVKPAESIPNF